MQTKQLLGLSALLLVAGIASARPVPAEEWAGAPVPDSVSTLSRSQVIADLNQARSVAQAPQEAWAGTVASAALPAGTMSRAEVLADLSLWNKAGMAAYDQGDGTDFASPAYARSLSAYQQARSGPAFLAEVRRIEGARNHAVASAETSAVPSAN
ncbi:hypothetical protein [Variovorax terrae]|uniref:DUF4148 domain-containing protein n=1 Tax=Variovorax terrae TaxID=2923278 RepID=A0A9X1VZ59_9BURK|nr:hypothetical protein [Variovorax terrae]MCJ0765579.1 hypothetical protein [Variovorax terrae]